MKTECHCLYCPKHPLHKKRGTIESPTGFEPNRFILDSKKTGRVVNCLKPRSDAFDAFDIDPDCEEFPVTAYGDGCAMTGFERDGIVLYATCEDEGYEPPPQSQKGAK